QEPSDLGIHLLLPEHRIDDPFSGVGARGPTSPSRVHGRCRCQCPAGLLALRAPLRGPLATHWTLKRPIRSPQVGARCRGTAAPYGSAATRNESIRASRPTSAGGGVPKPPPLPTGQRIVAVGPDW